MILALVIIMFPTMIFASSCNHDNTSFNCVKYLSNYDGDTIRFNIPNVHPLLGENISIRIRGIDTAEIKTKNQCEKKVGIISQKIVHKYLSNAKRIDLKNIDRDKYFRIVADVYADDINVGGIILKQAIAYKYDGGTKQKIDWCKVYRAIASSTTLKDK